MSEWCGSQKKPGSDFRKLLQERLDKANPLRKPTAEEKRRLSKLEVIAAKSAAALSDRLERYWNSIRMEMIYITIPSFKLVF
ncbi:hypothetical protein N8500_10625 [Candidatus Puniceispirillum sp.]|nr:hypothetical protein [Candidatus Puniceispirillum sp.]